MSVCSSPEGVTRLWLYELGGAYELMLQTGSVRVAILQETFLYICMQSDVHQQMCTFSVKFLILGFIFNKNNLKYTEAPYRYISFKIPIHSHWKFPVNGDGLNDIRIQQKETTLLVYSIIPCLKGKAHETWFLLGQTKRWEYLLECWWWVLHNTNWSDSQKGSSIYGTSDRKW